MTLVRHRGRRSKFRHQAVEIHPLPQPVAEPFAETKALQKPLEILVEFRHGFYETGIPSSSLTRLVSSIDFTRQ